MFLEMFGNTIKYEKGGVESGFRHVEKGFYEPRLLHIKGKKQIRINLVETSVDSLNKTDSFILDLGQTVYVWNGPGTTRVKRTKALELSIKINNENNGGKGNIINLDESDSDAAKFWEVLKGTEEDIPEQQEEGDEVIEFEKIFKTSLT